MKIPEGIIMKKIAALLFVLFLCSNARADVFDYSPRSVIEESFYVVPHDKEEEFVKLYRTRLFPFWEEMRKMGIIKGRYRMFSQRLHTASPVWTYKTVVYFSDYESVDKWLKIRDGVYERLFPGEGGYRGMRKKVEPLHIGHKHWDEFIREIPLKQ